MNKLLYTLIIFFFSVNAIAGSVMLAEGEIIVLDTTTADIMPSSVSGVNSQTIQSNDETATSEVTQNEQIGYLKGSVSRSIFTSDVNGHEPVDKIDKLASNNRSVIYFTELRDMSGQTAVHRWEFNGNVMAETRFTIAGPRWRVWSSKHLLPTWTGEWKVSVLNGVGEVISEDIFSYVDEEITETNPAQQTESAVKNTNVQQEDGYINDNLN
ncbi:MAG: DUF2914 domain-containing protein [Gammaproteobacteria bacterium]